MKLIEFKSAHRQKHFDFFNSMNHPHFCVTADVNIHGLLAFAKEYQLSKMLTIVYAISRTCNDIKEFRWRIRDGKVYEHQSVSPSFAVATDVDDVFSFCTVKYSEDSKEFTARALQIMDQMKTNPSFEDEEGRDDFLFLSALPWIQFTGIQHAMHYHPSDSVPRISWGKYFKKDGQWHMPLSVQVHHATVDGRHVGQFYELFEKINLDAKTYFNV